MFYLAQIFILVYDNVLTTRNGMAAHKVIVMRAVQQITFFSKLHEVRIKSTQMFK